MSFYRDVCSEPPLTPSLTPLPHPPPHPPIPILLQEGFPISTTQCITGATIGVGLANGEWRAVNWRLFARILASWAITLPVAGTLAGCIFAFIAYAPSIPHSPADV
jgi:hypothetical protein